MVYHPQAPKELFGRRGLVAVVRKTGRIAPGDRVRLTGGAPAGG